MVVLQYIPDDAHAGVPLWSVETETKSVLAVQVRQNKREMLLTLTVMFINNSVKSRHSLCIYMYMSPSLYIQPNSKFVVNSI